MKKVLLTLLAVLFIFSCKVSPNKDTNKKSNTFFGRSDDDSAFQGSGALDDEYQAFTSMANAANSIMFVSDGKFIINLKSTKFTDAEKEKFDGCDSYMKRVNEYASTRISMLDFSSYETSSPSGVYYYSTDKDQWTDICSYLNVKFDKNGFVSSQNKNIVIESEYNKDIDKYIVYFRGENNTDFRWRFDITLLEQDSQIGCYGKLENLLDYEKVANGDDIKISKAGLLGTFYSTPIIHAPDIISKEIAEQGCTAIFANCKNLKRAPNILAKTLGDSAFYCAFYNCSALETPPETLFTLDLPNCCYTYMFSRCESLKTAPEIEAESVGYSSCAHMFEGCKLLINAPELEATSLRGGCYESMFSSCTSLENAPSVLPSDVIPESGYASMFHNCTSLKKAPSISASKASSSSCNYMFKNCSSLQSAPEALPANIDNYCFVEMFADCISLKTAPTLPSENAPLSCYEGMFQGCKSLEYGPSVLPAKSIDRLGYSCMFKDCISLKSAPEIKAESISFASCKSMFEGCQSLEEVQQRLYATEFKNCNSGFYKYSQCYANMFAGCASLKKAPELPAKTLPASCCVYMFADCTSLEEAPDLPATELAEECYKFMFKGCTSLTKAPAISAKRFSRGSCSSMFAGCTSLEIAPKLPATSLADSCYESMFEGCTSLKSAPALPAKSVDSSAYQMMFKDCTSLKKAPELPATKLSNTCYEGMFQGCTNLAIPPSTLPAKSIPYNAYKCMFDGCSMLEDIPYIQADNLEGISAEGSYVYSMFRGCNKLPISIKKTDTYKYPFVVHIRMEKIFGDDGWINGLHVLAKDTIYYKATKFGDQNYDDVTGASLDAESKRIVNAYNIPLVKGTSVPDFGTNAQRIADGTFKFNTDITRIRIEVKETPRVRKSGKVSYVDYINTIKEEQIYVYYTKWYCDKCKTWHQLGNNAYEVYSAKPPYEIHKGFLILCR